MRSNELIIWVTTQYSILSKKIRNECISSKFRVNKIENSTIKKFKDKFRRKVKTFNLAPKN